MDLYTWLEYTDQGSYNAAYAKTKVLSQKSIFSVVRFINFLFLLYNGL